MCCCWFEDGGGNVRKIAGGLREMKCSQLTASRKTKASVLLSQEKETNFLNELGS